MPWWETSPALCGCLSGIRHKCGLLLTLLIRADEWCFPLSLAEEL